MIRADLADARTIWINGAETVSERRTREESSFLAYKDDAGRVADFHALRHTFITSLAAGGVHPKLAQQLARHSTITLTMDRYTHTVLDDLSDALTALPDLDDVSAHTTQQRATGTLDGRSGERSGPERSRTAMKRPEKKDTQSRELGVQLGVSAAVSSPRLSPEVIEERSSSTKSSSRGRCRKPNRDDGSDAASRRVSSCGTPETRQPPNGLEPLTCGLQNRCSTN